MTKGEDFIHYLLSQVRWLTSCSNCIPWSISLGKPSIRKPEASLCCLMASLSRAMVISWAKKSRYISVFRMSYVKLRCMLVSKWGGEGLSVGQNGRGVNIRVATCTQLLSLNLNSHCFLSIVAHYLGHQFSLLHEIFDHGPPLTAFAHFCPQQVSSWQVHIAKLLHDAGALRALARSRSTYWGQNLESWPPMDLCLFKVCQQAKDSLGHVAAVVRSCRIG